MTFNLALFSSKLKRYIDFVGAKHCGDESIIKAENVDTAMLRPFSVATLNPVYSHR
jgi:hypothetical protein